MGSALVGIYRVGAVLAALFPTERIDAPDEVWAQSTTGLIRIAISTLSFVAMIVAMFVLFRTFRLDSRWWPLTPWIVIVALRVQVLATGGQITALVAPAAAPRRRGDTEHAGTG